VEDGGFAVFAFEFLLKPLKPLLRQPQESFLMVWSGNLSFDTIVLLVFVQPEKSHSGA
jgi:hypothetical protein